MRWSDNVYRLANNGRRAPTRFVACFDRRRGGQILGIAPSTLAKLRLSGNGPLYCKLGRRVVYRRQDLEVWLESRVAHNTSDADARLPKSLTQSVTARLDARSSESGSL